MGDDYKTEKTKKNWYSGVTWQTVCTIIFWAIISYFLFLLVKSELKHLGCFVLRQEQCSSPFYRVSPEPGDDNITLIQRIENGIRQPEEVVWWRRNFFVSAIVSFLVILICTRKWPEILPFVFSTIVVYVILASLSNWYDMHIWYRVREQQMRTVQQLRFNLNYDVESTAKGVYGPPNTTGVEFRSKDSGVPFNR